MSPVLTLDVDWAPDFMIDFVAEHLTRRRVKATWFITHGSPAIDRLRAHQDIFELGIHPNFAADSTQGGFPEEVLRHCLALVPGARCMRTHGLIQSTQLLGRVATTTPIRLDCSLYLPRTPNLRPVPYHFGSVELLRIPYCWEDGFEMLHPRPWWDLREVLGLDGGLKVLNFHPVHLYLNLTAFSRYEDLKRRLDLRHCTPGEVAGWASPATGPRTMFLDVLQHLEHTGGSRTLGEVGGQGGRP
ncbi:MAG: hypothetical protein V2A77_05290 [Pseudomonadota bacterium]